ncbi:MAG: hypothetical protein JW839_16950 [Candidatus Lokiarchaeota archaeon]|nr:hypothetical protein [Candidatus Lokiarchaeota archaeon]
MDKTWRERENSIAALVPALRDALLVRVRRKPVDVRVYFCKGVMDIVEYIREHTKGKEMGAQHHVFKILGKHAEFGTTGRLEVASKSERVDIYLDDTMASVEVKTLSMATLETIRGTAMAAFEGNPANTTWIFFLYAFEGFASPKPPCQYLLTWIAIDSLDIDFDQTARLVVRMVQKAKEQAAKKLGVPGKILVPVDNIITVVDKERELAEYKVKVEKEIADKDKEIADKDKEIADKDKEIAELKRRLS